MIDCKALKLTIDQIDNMRHAVGLEIRELRKNQWKFTSYRNYFTTSLAGDKDWDYLASEGLAERSDCIEGKCVVYRVTKAGLKVLEYIFGVIVEVK